MGTYAKLLRRQVDDILRKNDPFSNSSNERDRYFKNLGKDDLFLDPDTGIAPNKNATKKHIKACEVACLLNAAPNRMLMVYQSKWQRKSMAGTLERVLSIEGLREFHRFAYDAGQVGMVFISRDRKRIGKALESFQSWFGPGVSTRIIH
jgi:hypothetical protein